jgi:hypothetical protein
MASPTIHWLFWERYCAAGVRDSVLRENDPMTFDFPSMPPSAVPEADQQAGDAKASWREIVVAVTMTTAAVGFVSFVAVVMSMA